MANHSNSNSATYIRDRLPQIWKTHNLGTIQRVTQPSRGRVNYSFVVNDAYVVRFARRGTETSRFESEVLAYTRLADSEVPVPLVVEFDETRQHVPFEYLITDMMPGDTVADGWHGLSEEQQARVAREAGKYLSVLHHERFSRFGTLGTLHPRGFERWYDYVEDYFQRYARQAQSLGIIGESEARRIGAVLAGHQSLRDEVVEGSLIHNDYHFENILYQDGRVSGIVDFEWALSGDPAWDFVVEDQWDEQCPGSKKLVQEEYARRVPEDASFQTRVSLYKLLTDLEFLMNSWNSGMLDEYALRREQFFSALKAFESV